MQDKTTLDGQSPNLSMHLWMSYCERFTKSQVVRSPLRFESDVARSHRLESCEKKIGN